MSNPSQSAPTIAIIGTAGRGKVDDPTSDRRRLEAQGEGGYLRMLAETKKVIDQITGGGPYRLISGGAAWADHLAVVLYLMRRPGRCEGLTLHLPCAWETTRFKDSGVYDFRTNPGGTSNALHRYFSRATKRNSFAELNEVITAGATTTIGDGFFDRNALVAKEADYAIALTFGDGPRLKDGGTQNTMKAFHKKPAGKANSFHIDLGTWQAFSPAEV